MVWIRSSCRAKALTWTSQVPSFLVQAMSPTCGPASKDLSFFHPRRWALRWLGTVQAMLPRATAINKGLGCTRDDQKERRAVKMSL